MKIASSVHPIFQRRLDRNDAYVKATVKHLQLGADVMQNVMTCLKKCSLIQMLANEHFESIFSSLNLIIQLNPFRSLTTLILTLSYLRIASIWCLS